MKLIRIASQICMIAAFAIVLAGCRRPPTAATPSTPTSTTTAPVPQVPPEVTKPHADIRLPGQKNQVGPSTSTPSDFAPSAAVEIFGNFETAGVIVAQPAGVVPGKIARVRCYQNVSGKWRAVQDLVRSGSSPNFITSLFWLKPDSQYQVKVVFEDADEMALKTVYGDGRTRAEPTLPDAQRVLVVSPSGDNANPGTVEQPMRTVSNAITVATAGTTILLREGVYHEGDLVFTKNGTAKQPIILSSYAGEFATLDAANPELMDAKAWKDSGDGVYQHAFEGICYNVTLQDIQTGERTRLLPLKTAAELRSRSVVGHGSFEKLAITGAFSCDGKTANLLPPKPLENYIVHIAKYTKGFILENRKHITFDRIGIRHFGRSHYSTAAFLYRSSDILFQNCKLIYNDTGIWLKMESDRITVQDCTFEEGIFEWPFGMLKMGGAVASFESGAVYMDSKFSGRGIVIRRNMIKGMFDGAHLTSWTVNTARSNEIDFYQNIVINCVDDVLEIDGFARNIRIFDNYMRGSLTGVSLAQALDGPTFIAYNVIADCGVVPATTREGNWSYPFKTNGGPQPKIGSGPIFFYHNTAYTTDPDSRAALIKLPNWKLITFRNNIWFGQKHGFQSWKSPPSPMDMDYDDVYVADESSPLFVLAYKQKYQTLDDVRAKFGWLKHGISADPMVKDPEKGDYRLDAQSACIDAGVTVPGINEGRTQGSAPDIGAYEIR